MYAQRMFMVGPPTMASYDFHGPLVLHTDPIIGYRAFKLTSEEPHNSIVRDISYPGDYLNLGKKFRLRSVSVHYQWINTTNIAKHNGKDECEYGGIHGGCEYCGFWAYNEAARLYMHFGNMPILGMVSLWGNIIEGTLGYRAEKAYLERLIVSYPNRDVRKQVAQDLREHYKVEVYEADSSTIAMGLLKEWEAERKRNKKKLPAVGDAMS